MASRNSTPTKAELEATLKRFRTHLYARCSLAETTIENYCGSLRRILPITGVKPSHKALEKIIVGMRMAKVSYSYLTYTCIALERYMLMLGDPIKLGRPPKSRSVIKNVLTESEITLLIASTKSVRDRALLAVLAYSGVRNSELTQMKIGDVNIAEQCIHVSGKGARQRKVCVGGACVEALVNYLNVRNGMAQEWLFVTVRNENKLTPQDVRKLVRRCAKRANLKKRVYPHLLRHSLATNLLIRGASLVTIKDQLGHSFFESTMPYLNVTIVQLQRDYRHYQPAYM